MGGWQSTTRGTEEPEDQSTCSQYRYPPKVGNYFSTHFIMGGEKFDSPQPESFLFGDNSDLNFLGSKPVPFPYPPPQANEPTKTLKALINIRRDSLHFVKVKNAEGEEEVGKYNIVFTLDSDVRSNITIFYLASEEVGPQSVVYTPKQETMCSPTYIYRKGSGQMFSQPDHIFQPGLYDGDGLDGVGNDILPVVIHCVADEGEEPRQSHITIGVIDKNSDGTFALKTLKQKLFVDGLCYLLQEIYGVERKGVEEIIDGELDDSGAECVVCMCDNRDTLILPCRHLCLCNACADSLRYQANNCPICRAPFRALLQIRALQKTGHSATHPALAGEAPPEGVPPGYEIVSLVEALNGPFAPPPPPLQLTDEGKKKKQKRRASVPHGKDGKKSVDKTVFPPVEEIDPASLPPPPSPPPHPAAGDVTIVNEKKNSARSITKSKSYEKEVGTAEEHKITLEVLSQDSVLSGGSDIVEEELQKLQEEDVSLVETEVKDEDNPSAEAEEDLENDKDDLKNEQEVGNVEQDKLIRSGVLCSNYSPEFGTASDPEDVDEDLEDVEEDLEDEGDDDVDDDDVEVVSLRGRKQEEQLSLPGTPRSGNSIRSSQESSTSVNSTNQLLGRERREGDDVEGSIRKEDRKKRGKSSIVPEADHMA